MTSYNSGIRSQPRPYRHLWQALIVLAEFQPLLNKDQTFHLKPKPKEKKQNWGV